MLTRKLFKAVADTGITRVAAGGGVAANSYLRTVLKDKSNIEVFFPSMELCTDNAAMVAGIGYHYLDRGDRSGCDLTAGSRVPGFKKSYP
jgi:N6-L-threonylcarbamoyladenine synthase